MNSKKIVGAFLLLFVFAGMFAMMVQTSGWKATAICWVGALIGTAIIATAVRMICE